MAGVPAGRLSIEIVAEIARLQADLDKAKRAVGAASKDIAANARYANDNLAGMAGGIAKAGGQSRLATHHLANLSFQLQDIFVGLQGGQKPMTVFLQQGSQIGQIMMQAGIGVGGLVRSVAGMVSGFVLANPLLLAAGVAAGVVAAAIGLMTDEINENSKVHVTWTDTLLGAFDAIKAGISEKVTAAFKAMGLDVGEVWETVKSYTKAAINLVIGWTLAVPRLIADTYDKIPPAFGDAFYSAANLAIQALNWLIAKAAEKVNWFVDTFNSVFGSKIPRAAMGGIKELANPYKGAMASLGSAAAKSLTASFTKDYIGDAAAAVSPFAQARARDRMAAEAAKAGRAAGHAAGQAAGKAAAEAATMSFAEAFKGFEIDPAAQKVWNDTAATNERIEDLKREAKAIGLVGWERERLLTLLKDGADIQRLQNQLNAAEDVGNDALAKSLAALIGQRQEELRLKIANGDATEAATAKQDKFNDSLRETVYILQDIGGLAGVLGGVLGVLSGNTGALRGPIGDLLNIGVGVDPVTKEVRKLGDVFKDGLGKLGDKLTGVLQQVGTGIMAGAAAFGKQGTLGTIASGAGGILGGIGGSMLAGTVSSAIGGTLGSAIGSAVPVIGTILGGIAGSFIGSLFGGGTKKGSAIISGGSIAGYTGNKGSLKDQAGEIAGGLLDTLQQIAGQFGQTLDAAAIGRLSVGIRNGKYVVDATGQGNTKGTGVKSFGEDAGAAAEYAIKLMLDRGAVAMRAGSLKIIKEATDLQTGLAKALQFEEIVNMLEGGSSQLVASVKALRSQFDGMIDAMKAAGSSVEDLTRAQELQQQRINELIAQAGDNYRSTFYTDSQNTAFAKQQIHAVLDPLGKGAIDTVGEYMSAVEAAQKDTSDAGLAWLDTLYSLTDAFGVLKAASDAAAASRQAEAAQKAADTAQAKSNAESALRQAYERESGALQQTIDKFNGFADTLADFRKELIAGDDATASYAMRFAELRRVGALAGMGDETAIGALPGVGRDFLASARNRAGSSLEYQRAVALVARYAGTAEQASRGMATEAQKQLDAINKQVGALIDLTDGVLSLTEAIKQFGAAGDLATAGTPADRARKGELLQARADRQEQRILERAARLQGYREQRIARNDNSGSPDGDLVAASLDRLEQRMANNEAATVANAGHTSKLLNFFEDAEAEGGGLKVVVSA